MTPRERLLTAISVQQPDRVPISCYELVGYDFETWYNRSDSYKPLMDLIRQETDCLYMAPLPAAVFGNAADAVRTIDSQSSRANEHITTNKWRQGKSLFIETIYNTPRGELRSLHRVDDDIHTVWTLEHLLKTIDDVDKYLSFDWEQADELDLNKFAKTQNQLGDNGIMLPTVSDPICEAAELFEMGQFLVFAITQTDKIRYLMDNIHERQIAHLNSVLQAGVSAGVKWSECLFRICGPEYATPPYLSPEYFATLVMPYVKRMSDILHQYGAKVRVHCHGKIASVIDQIMQMQPDALDPIEPPPDGDITLGDVKKRIGDRVCLFGNIELKLLEHGKPDQVRDFVIDALGQAKAGGGFVCMPTAAPINEPLSPKTEQNYRVFIETALEYGRY